MQTPWCISLLPKLVWECKGLCCTGSKDGVLKSFQSFKKMWDNSSHRCTNWWHQADATGMGLFSKNSNEGWGFYGPGPLMTNSPESWHSWTKTMRDLFFKQLLKNTGIRSPHPVLNRIGWLSKPQVHPIFFLDSLSSDPQPIWLSARHTWVHASSSWWRTENTFTGRKAKLSRHSTIWKKKPHLLFSCTLTALAKP